MAAGTSKRTLAVLGKIERGGGVWAFAVEALITCGGDGEGGGEAGGRSGREAAAWVAGGGEGGLRFGRATGGGAPGSREVLAVALRGRSRSLAAPVSGGVRPSGSAAPGAGSSAALSSGAGFAVLVVAGVARCGFEPQSHEEKARRHHSPWVDRKRSR